MNDDGSASVIMLSLVAVSITLLMSFTVFANYFISRARIHNIADAVALSSAQGINSYLEDPCVIAKDTANRNNVLLLSCEVDNNYVEVQVKEKHANIIATSRAESDF